MQFVLDTPTAAGLKKITRFSGWCLSSHGEPARAIRLSVNGKPTLRLIGSQRVDVAAHFPDLPFARNAGFLGDLVVPEACRLGDEISISIEVELPDGQRRAAYARTFFVDELANNWPVRDRNYDLAQLLQHPYTGRPCQVTEPDVGSPAPICYLIAGTPHFHPRWDLPAVRLLEDSVTHPWGEKTCQLISELTSNELFLDFGAGMKRPADLLPNAVLLDAIHFPNIDVVNSAEKIPFKPGSFDLVISQAVFEHLPNPFQSANEIFRVLKPGGKVLIDTGFMVPFHADPDHYFNMTIEGLRKVMERFEIIQLFVQPYMMPSDGLVLQIDTVLPLMRAGVWRERLQTLLDDLRREGRELDRDLGLLGQRMIAAGVSVIARKPVC